MLCFTDLCSVDDGGRMRGTVTIFVESLRRSIETLITRKRATVATMVTKLLFIVLSSADI